MAARDELSINNSGKTVCLGIALSPRRGNSTNSTRGAHAGSKWSQDEPSQLAVKFRDCDYETSVSFTSKITANTNE